MIGIAGDTIPTDALVNGRVLYAYTMMASGRCKCAGYATPNALAILRAGDREVIVRDFDPTEPVPNIIE